MDPKPSSLGPLDFQSERALKAVAKRQAWARVKVTIMHLVFWPLFRCSLLGVVMKFLVVIISSFRLAATTAWLDSILRLPSKPHCEDMDRKIPK